MMKRVIVISTVLAFLSLTMLCFFIGCSDEQETINQTGFSTAPPMRDFRNVPPFDGNTVLVKFRDSAPSTELKALYLSLGATVKYIIPWINVTVLSVPTGRAEAVVKKLDQNRKLVEYAELNYTARAFYEPNDPMLPDQWGIYKINAPTAWDVTKGSTNIPIAIIDTGIDNDHSDLSAKVIRERNFTDSPTNDDLFGHGTHCAGIASAITDNGKGVAGTGYNCTLMDYKVLGDYGWGYYDWVAKGIVYAAIDGAKVLSMSFGGYWPSLTLRNAVAFAWNHGSVLVAAAGNDGWNRANYPAYYEQCIATGATDQNDKRAWFSNYGKWVDVAAPGCDILSTMPNHPNYIGFIDYGYLSGTSMATPFVAGTAALVWSTSYGVNNAAVRNRIEKTCVYIEDWLKYGRIDAAAAVGATASWLGLVSALVRP